jgi:hypothetical protein
MEPRSPQPNQRWWTCLLLSLALHAAVLSVAVERHAPLELVPPTVVTVQFLRPSASPPVEQDSPPTAPEPVIDEPTGPVLLESPAIELLEIAPRTSQIEVAQPKAEEPRIDPVVTRRILSSRFGLEPESERTWLTRVDEAKAPDPDAFLVPNRPSMDMVLNSPSLQLPFEDRRIYIIDSYSPGIEGSFERFWDRVTLPFGWTTKGGTHFECAWILVIGGCGWGPNELFYRELKRREKES